MTVSGAWLSAVFFISVFIMETTSDLGAFSPKLSLNNTVDLGPMTSYHENLPMKKAAEVTALNVLQSGLLWFIDKFPSSIIKTCKPLEILVFCCR